MFGEDESESPRAGSPWDALLSGASSAPASGPVTPSPKELEPDFKRTYTVQIPSLVPEAEAGNVEYKLQLTDPTPERFLRLVTQLKWRLLEGGGQAYYELGVSDTGALIGLERAKMEKTLQTLDAMAGEIGASVIIVREVEVPNSWTKSTRLPFQRATPPSWDESYDSTYDGVLPITASSESDETSADDEEPPIDEGVFLYDIEVSEMYKPVSTTPDVHQRVWMGMGIGPGITETTGKKALKGCKKAKRNPKDNKALRNSKDKRERPSRFTSDTAHRKEESAIEGTDTVVESLTNLHVPLAATPAVALSADEVEPGKRVIVEALVVRKLSSEEAFLDFAGFDLGD